MLYSSSAAALGAVMLALATLVQISSGKASTVPARCGAAPRVPAWASPPILARGYVNAHRVYNWCNLVSINVQGERPFQAAMTPMPSTRTTAAFSAGSAPGSSGSEKKCYIPHSKCSTSCTLRRNVRKQHFSPWQVGSQRGPTPRTGSAPLL